MFNIDIQHDFSIRKYYIVEEEQPEVNDRILEAFDIFNALNISERLSKNIHFEKRKLQGTENLYGLLHGIKNHLQTEFIYQKFWDEKPENRIVNPLALKEFKNRWYLIGKDLKDDAIKTFALDRLTCLHVTKKKFIHDSFEIEEYYKYCFGIIRPDNDEPQEIILSFEAFQGKYIKSFPLHETQEIIYEDENELQIKLKIYITFDLLMELLSYGNSMKVLSPKSLADKLKSEFQKAYKQY